VHGGVGGRGGLGILRVRGVGGFGGQGRESRVEGVEKGMGDVGAEVVIGEDEKEEIEGWRAGIVTLIFADHLFHRHPPRVRWIRPPRIAGGGRKIGFPPPSHRLDRRCRRWMANVLIGALAGPLRA